MKQVLIIGDSLLKKSIKEQFLFLGYRQICECSYDALDSYDFERISEIVLFSDSAKEDVMAADNDAIATLQYLSRKISANRPIVHLLLLSQTSLWILQTMDLPEEVNEKLEVYPFTHEDMWAKNVLVQLPGIRTCQYPSLDRISIGKDSKTFVHVVIIGLNSQAESIAIHTALTAHFPNYHSSDEVPLRTRITVIENGIVDKRDTFIAKYQHLFDNSCYRTIDLKNRTSCFHRPIYYGKRADFVDVEWEFVDGDIHNPEMVAKVSNWSDAENQQMTIFICYDDDERNLTESISLPRCVYDRDIPVMVQQSQNVLSESLLRSRTYKNIRLYGMRDRGYDVKLPLARLARYLKYFYDCSYGNVGVPTELPLVEVERSWRDEKSFKMRFSNIYNVMTIAPKMRSLGHDAGDADTFYALTQEEIETLAETEHNRWSVERLIMGVRPCTDEETEEIRKDIKALKKAYKNRDIHFDLRAFSELEEDGTGKNAQVYDYDLTACIPLIVKAFYEESIHGE